MRGRLVLDQLGTGMGMQPMQLLTIVICIVRIHCRVYCLSVYMLQPCPAGIAVLDQFVQLNKELMRLELLQGHTCRVHAPISEESTRNWVGLRLAVVVRVSNDAD